MIEGVNLAGYLSAESGMGELARAIAASLRAAGIPMSFHLYDRAPNRQAAHPPGEPGTDSLAGVNLVVVNADQLSEFVLAAGPAFFAGRPTIGCWAWEVEAFPPPLAQSAALVDEVWCLSEFSARALRATVDRPVHNVPPAVVLPRAVGSDRAVRVPDGFVFLFCFDFMSVFERKNPLAVIDAFDRAFCRDDGATLVVKTLNGHWDPASYHRLLSAAARRADVRVIDGYLPAPRRLELTASCDAYVSLHRAEGFGLTLAEAMGLGKPVIATGYSGNLEFMDETNGYLVPYELVEIPPGCAPYPAGARWAEPDVDAAAEAMRQVFEDPRGAQARGARARRVIAERHSPEARANLVAMLVDRSGQGNRAHETRSPDRSTELQPVEAERGPPSPHALSDMVESGPDPSSRSRWGPFSRLHRRLVLRATRHVREHQRDVDREILAAVAGLEAKLAAGLDPVRAEARAAQAGCDVHADVLGQLRQLRSQITELERSLRAEALRLQGALRHELSNQVADECSDLRDVVMALARMVEDGEAKLNERVERVTAALDALALGGLEGPRETRHEDDPAASER